MKPQLTMRDLFWLVALVAMGLGWWADHAALSKYAKRQFDKFDGIKSILTVRGVTVTEKPDGGLFVSFKDFN